MAKAKKKKAHCKRVPVKKGSSKKRLMCFNAKGRIVSAKRSKAGKKAAVEQFVRMVVVGAVGVLGGMAGTFMMMAKIGG